jgi:hypothetical protein
VLASFVHHERLLAAMITGKSARTALESPGRYWLTQAQGSAINIAQRASANGITGTKNRERAQSISMLCSKVPGDAGVNAEDQEGVKSGNIRRGSSSALVSAGLAFWSSALEIQDSIRADSRRRLGRKPS